MVQLHQAARAALFLACGGILAAGEVAASPDTEPELATQGMRRAGPFHLAPFVLVKDVGYDDNIRFDAQEKQGDSTATLGTGLRAVLLAGDRGGVNLLQEIDYVAFGRSTDLNHWNTVSSARGVLLMRGLALSLGDQFTSERERPSTEVDQRLRLQDNALSAALRSAGPGRLGFRASLRHESVDYFTDDPASTVVARLLSRNENTLALTGEAHLLPKTTFTLEGAIERVSFDDASQGRDTRSHALMPGVRFDPSASLQGEIKLGIESIHALDRPGSDVRGTVGEAHLSTRLGRAARIRGDFSRSYVFSALAENIFYVGSEWSAAYEQFFSRRLSAEVLYGQGLNHYPLPVSRASPAPFQGIRDDHLNRRTISLRYRVNGQLSLVASGALLVRDSTDDYYDRTRHFYAFGADYSF